MFSVKPERLLTRVYPDQALLDSLTNVAFEQAKIPEHEFIQFRRLQSLIYQIRVAGYDIEAMQTEAFLGAIQHAYVNCKVAVTIIRLTIRSSATRRTLTATFMRSLA